MSSTQSLAKDFFELGRLVVISKLSLREFSERMAVKGFSPSMLSYAQRWYERNVAHNFVEEIPTMTALKEIVRGRPFTDVNTSANTPTELQLEYGERSRSLVSGLHYYVRHSERENAQLCVEELMNGVQGVRTTCVNELELMLDEECSDPLLIWASDVLIRRIRNEEGRIASNNGIAVRCAMIVAGWLADTPKDRTVDDHFVLTRIFNQLGDRFKGSIDSTVSLLAQPFKPLELPSMEEMHRSGKSGLEGDLAMAQNGSKTTEKTEYYQKQREEMEAQLLRMIESRHTEGQPLVDGYETGQTQHHQSASESTASKFVPAIHRSDR